MSAARTVRSGMVPAAALVAALTALATIGVQATHVSTGYALDRAVRETVRREREIQRLEARRAELLSPAAIRAAAERLEVPLVSRQDGRPTTLDLDTYVRERSRRAEDGYVQDRGRRGVER